MDTVTVCWNSRIYNRFKNIYDIQLYKVTKWNGTAFDFDYNKSLTKFPKGCKIKEQSDGTIEAEAGIDNLYYILSPNDIVMEVPEELFVVYDLQLFVL